MNLITDIKISELEKMLLNSEFTEEGWIFNNAKPKDVKRFYMFYRNAVLDGTIPYSAVTGININGLGKKYLFDVTNYSKIKESLNSIFRGLEMLVFPPVKKPVSLKSEKLSGIITGKVLVFSGKDIEFRPLTNPYICTSAAPVTINLRISASTGIKRTHEITYDKKINELFVPVRPNFGLYRFIVVTGCSESAVYHRIINDIDLDGLKKIIINHLLGKNEEYQAKEQIKAIKVSDIFNALYSRASMYGKAIKAINEIYYEELKNNAEYIDIKDEYFFENQKAEKLGRILSGESEISIRKINKEFEIFRGLFIRDTKEETAQYLSGIKRVSVKSASAIAEIICEYV